MQIGVLYTVSESLIYNHPEDILVELVSLIWMSQELHWVSHHIDMYDDEPQKHVRKDWFHRW
jgi:hypothetical protein